MVGLGEQKKKVLKIPGYEKPISAAAQLNTESDADTRSSTKVLSHLAYIKLIDCTNRVMKVTKTQEVPQRFSHV